MSIKLSEKLRQVKRVYFKGFFVHIKNNILAVFHTKISK